MVRKMDRKSAQALAALGASKGGHARAEALTAEERSAVAKKAALARWGGDLPRATHYGELVIGALTIPCAVLADGTRVLTQWGFYRAIGRSGSPAGGRGSHVEKMAPFLALENLRPFISDDLAASTKPIEFQLPNGVRAFGYRAEVLPKVCTVYLQARRADVLLKSQLKFAAACEVIADGLAHVGIVALVDEATGYQADRARDALAKILERFIAKELRPWVKTFQPEFYEQMFRLRGWQWKGMSVNRPQVVAHYTKDLVYARLAPGVLEELKRVTPRNEAGKPKAKLFQSLTEETGHPKLKEHLAAVVALMRISPTWEVMMDHVDRALPKFGETLKLLPPDPTPLRGDDEQ